MNLLQITRCASRSGEYQETEEWDFRHDQSGGLSPHPQAKVARAVLAKICKDCPKQQLQPSLSECTEALWLELRDDRGAQAPRVKETERSAKAPDYHAVANSVASSDTQTVLMDLRVGVENLALEFQRTGSLPVKARSDAIRLVAASWLAIDYLLTWNCRHLANAQILRKLEREAVRHGNSRRFARPWSLWETRRMKTNLIREEVRRIKEELAQEGTTISIACVEVSGTGRLNTRTPVRRSPIPSRCGSWQKRDHL